MKCATFSILLLAVLLPLSSDFNLIARSISFSEAASPATTTEGNVEDKKTTTIKIDTKTPPKPEEVLSTATAGNTNASITDTPVICKNGTDSCIDEPLGPIGSIGRALQENSGMLFRAMYVLLGVTGIVVIYFMVRAVRLRRKRANPRKYGILAQSDRVGGGLEMEPLGDGYNDEDDYTVFELNGQKRSQS